MRVDFHGIRLSVEGEGRASAAAAELLGGLPADRSPGESDIRILLRPRPPQPRPPRARAFFHGIVDVHEEGADLVLSDGWSRSRVHAGGRLVEVEVAEESLRDAHLFAHVFLLISLVLALRWREMFHVHAGALVGPHGRVILVAGEAGAGKSTTTLALMEAGCAYLGDDAVFLGTRAGVPALLALPRAFHVTPRTAAAFPRLAVLLGDLLPSGEKRRLDPCAAWPGMEREVAGMPALILLPGVEARQETVVERVGAADALGALIESSTYVVLDGLPAGPAHLAALRGVADAARAFRLRLGRDLLERPAEVATRVLQATTIP